MGLQKSDFCKLFFFKKIPDRAERGSYRAERESFCQMGQNARWARSERAERGLQNSEFFWKQQNW